MFAKLVFRHSGSDGLMPWLRSGQDEVATEPLLLHFSPLACVLLLGPRLFSDIAVVVLRHFRAVSEISIPISTLLQVLILQIVGMFGLWLLNISVTIWL
jgi:hypothetical protein